MKTQSIDQASANFSYRNATLAVEAAAAIDPTDAPITLEGRIPYALPFMTVQPPTNQLAVMAVVPGDSFDVINTLTEGLVRWVAGDGEVRVQVGGTLDQPIVAGTAMFSKGAIASDLLTTPITNLTGDGSIQSGTRRHSATPGKFGGWANQPNGATAPVAIRPVTPDMGYRASAVSRCRGVY